MKNHYFLGIAVAVAATAGVASADAQTLGIGGPGALYVGVEGGWTGPETPATGSSTSAKISSLSEDLDDGYNVGARLGYRLGTLRLEEEFRYQHSGVGSITDGVPPSTAPASGYRDAYAFMTNAIYDFDIGGPLTPHIGAGIGAVRIHDSWSVPLGRCDDETVWEFGYQAIAGVRYSITRSLALDVDYRYLATTDPTFVFSGSGAATAGITGQTFDSTFATHSVMASLTESF